ncbi:hypothetical protein HKX48_006923 [Thoreauomyces humboldtii]|nr:hypothetical protein HKX48_006923 [Thoreauomyces humboldtii]
MDDVDLGPGVEHLLEERCGGDPGLFWKEVYRDWMVRKRNWEKGRYVLLTVPMVDVRDSINSFWFDSDRILLGSRRHRLALFHITSPSSWAHLASRPDPRPLVPDVSFEAMHHVPIMALGLPTTAAGSHLLASVDGGGTLVVWNIFSGAVIASVADAHDGGISGCAITDGGKRVVTVGFDRVLRVHELKLSEPVVPSISADLDVLQPLQRKDTWKKSGRRGSTRSTASEQIKGTLDRSESEKIKSRRGSTKPEIHRTSSLPADTRTPRKRPMSTSSTPAPLSPTATASASALKHRLKARLEKLRLPRVPLPTDAFSPTSSTATAVDQPVPSTYELTCTHALKGHSGDIFTMVVMRDENMVVTGSMDHTIKVWDLERRSVVRNMRGHTDSVTSLCAIDDFVFSSSLDKTIRQWDPIGGRCVQTLLGHSKWVKTLAVDDRVLVSGGWDETVLVWDWRTGTLLHSFPINHGPIVGLQFDVSRIAVVCRGEGWGHQISILEFGSQRVGAPEAITDDVVVDGAVDGDGLRDENDRTLELEEPRELQSMGKNGKAYHV